MHKNGQTPLAAQDAEFFAHEDVPFGIGLVIEADTFLENYHEIGSAEKEIPEFLALMHFHSRSQAFGEID